jgi:hypothetical protein
MIDYQVESKYGGSGEQEKATQNADPGRRYIRDFKGEVEELLDQHRLSEYVEYTDKDPNLLDQE